MELDRELKYFESIRSKLLESSKGQYALIKEKNLIGTFKSEAEAYKAGIEKYGNVPFLIKEIVSKDSIDFIPILSIGV